MLHHTHHDRLFEELQAEFDAITKKEERQLFLKQLGFALAGAVAGVSGCVVSFWLASSVF